MHVAVAERVRLHNALLHADALCVGVVHVDAVADAVPPGHPDHVGLRVHASDADALPVDDHDVARLD